MTVVMMDAMKAAMMVDKTVGKMVARLGTQLAD